jgi:antitoxin Phd
MAPLVIGFTEVRKRLSEVTDEVNRTGRSVIVLKNNRPWVSIAPVSSDASSAGSPVVEEALHAFRSMRAESAAKGFATEDEIEAAIAEVRSRRTVE